MERSPVPAAQPPPEPHAPVLGPASAAAAGLTAVAKTAGLVGAMGVVRGTQALLDVNQHGGFDCQSCAWPSPDGERHTFEFCENGAKAVAAAGLADLQSVEGVSAATAKKIYDHFHAEG